MSEGAPIELGDTSSSEDEVELIDVVPTVQSARRDRLAQVEIDLSLPNPELALRGKTDEDAIDVDDDDILSVHTVHDVDHRVDSNWDDVTVFELSSSEEEDDTESISSAEFLLRRKPFLGDRNFKEGKVREPVINPPEVLGDYPTRKHLSIEQIAKDFKKEHNKQDDEEIRSIEEAARKVFSSRQPAFQTKTKLLRDLQKKKRKQLKRMAKKAQNNKKELSMNLSENQLHHIRGDYLDDPCYPKSEDRCTTIMVDENFVNSDDVDELLEKCYKFDNKGWTSYKDGLQQFRTIPRYIVEQRIKEAEEIVRLLQVQTMPEYAIVSYIGILTKLSTASIYEILKHHLEKEKTRNEDEFMEAINLKMFCPRCEIYGCTIHGLVDVQNYSYRTAAEVAMRKEESGFWKKEGVNSTPLICVPCDKTGGGGGDVGSDDAKALSQKLAKELCFIYEGDLDKVSKLLGASKHRISEAMRFEKDQYPTKYEYLKEVDRGELLRFHGIRENQEYFEPYITNEKGKSAVEEKDKSKADYVPCIHEGSCSMETCPCMQNGHACTNHCIMGPLSPNFFPGCECKSKCTTNRCPCYAGRRECDPDLCKNCQTCTDPIGVSLKEERKQLCRNDNIRMHRQIKGLYYKMSPIPNAGLGMFCDTDIRRNSYIGEYVGELLSEEELIRREENGRVESNKYYFDLPNGCCIDAIRHGNITKYMNHSFKKTGRKNQNVRAVNMKVNGEPRIAFFSQKNIPAHTEMFFDYGKKYPTEFEKNPKKVPAVVDV